MSLLGLLLMSFKFFQAGAASSKLVATGELNVGLIIPQTGLTSFTSIAPASTMAVQDAQTIQGFLPDYNITIYYANSQCSGGAALGAVADLQAAYSIDAYVGLACSASINTAGYLVNYWNLPLVTFGSSTSDVTRTFSTLIRLVDPSEDVFRAFLYMLQYYGWTKIAVVMGADTDNNCDITITTIVTALGNNNVTLAQTFVWSTGTPDDVTTISWLSTIRDSARIVLMCGTGKFTRRFMLLAQSQNMTNGDYVFVRMNLVPRPNTKVVWLASGYGIPDDGLDDLAKLAMQPMILLHPDVISAANDAFQLSVLNNLQYPPWNYNATNLSTSPFAMYLYDSMMIYMNATNQMVNSGISPRNGTAFAETAKKITTQGKTGFISFTSIGDRISNFQIWALEPGASSYAPYLQITNSVNGPTGIQARYVRNWGLTGNTPPPDTPVCGFFGELCPTNDTSNTAVTIGATVSCVILVSLVTIVFILYRRRMYEKEMENLAWKVNYEDIVFVSARNLSRQSKASMKTDDSNSQHMKSSDLSDQPSSADNSMVASEIGGRCRVGVYRGITVCVKTLKSSVYFLSTSDHAELKMMRSLTSDNLTPFVGLCVDPMNVCILTKYCVRGSLQDTLHNADIKLDADFKIALLRDLIVGLDFLHKSPLKSHGRLKSTNCVIDSRWVLQITDWGLWNLRQADVYDDDEAKFRALLWTAPEHLRNPPPRNGSQSGDIFSLAIIMQEILFRAYPYAAKGDVGMVTRDLVGRVRNGETPPFRPQLPDDITVDLRLIQLMMSCWQEDCTARPSISSVKSTFYSMTKGKNLNLMDHMLKMMEKYTTDLEEVISERTRQLIDEKRKTDLLLYKLMPVKVADSLKSGNPIKPELYPKVAVYFSDVVGFTTLASDSTPIEVVNFLNDLWSLFDDTIAKYDVYKVETIGDAYMVASGLPVPNEVGYASELANMALDILSNVLTFKIRHRPEQQLRVRIGLHTGPVVAGVVGHTMPRYCLFGDTVNLASRMESTGEALRIQISQQACDALKNLRPKFLITKRGDTEIKGKGLLTTYWLHGREGRVGQLPTFDG